jgi:hypothetical protein
MFLRKFAKAINPYLNSVQQRVSGDICPEQDFRRILKLECERADRDHHKFSLIVLDTKAVNGDNAAIRTMIRKINCRVRKIDQVGWYDSERIGILLPYTSFQGACELAEEITNPSIFESGCAIYVYPTERAVENKY